MKFALWIALAAPAIGCAAEIDWQKAHAETIEHYVALLRIDTSNPPGNESKAADYLRRVFEKEGIPTESFALVPNRANLVARLKGNGSKKPLLLMGHTDVVGVQREKWSVAPFAGILKDGYYYARGANDDKDSVAANLMAMLLLKRQNIALDRDVIFLAEAGEEGTTQFGIDFLVKEHWPAIEAEYALAEGGYTISRDGDVRVVQVVTAEKSPRPMKLVAHGVASHGSKPTTKNAVLKLATALAKFENWQPPMRLNDTTRTYFERLALASIPEKADRYNNVTNPQRTEAIQRYFLENETEHFSMLRTSIVPTVINAGFRSNVIPSEAEATIDVRILPDEDLPKLMETIRGVINDPQIELKQTGSWARPQGVTSRLDTEMFRAIETTQRQLYPNAITIPRLATGATDSAQLRAKGVHAYGIGSILDENEGADGGAHSDNERLLKTSVEKYVDFIYAIATRIAATPAAQTK